jgi:murein DD-endopeptidase MepM/ murein hydrolase activator NlpD
MKWQPPVAVRSGFVIAVALFLPLAGAANNEELNLSGHSVQGGLLFGTTVPGARATLDDLEIPVTSEGQFVIGFGRDETGSRQLTINTPQGKQLERSITVTERAFNIERVDGLPPSRVTPGPEALARIRAEGAMVTQARRRRDNIANYAAGFEWPARGRLSGFYGSQRILNGEPRNPHYGLDIAAPEGTPVLAPAPGIITLTHEDMYYSGGTIILDHGQGLSSSFLHLSEVLVTTGTQVKTGDLIGRIGSTGRATGPHLDWRMSWHNRRVDPQLLLPEQPAESAE